MLTKNRNSNDSNVWVETFKFMHWVSVKSKHIPLMSSSVDTIRQSTEYYRRRRRRHQHQQILFWIARSHHAHCIVLHVSTRYTSNVRVFPICATKAGKNSTDKQVVLEILCEVCVCAREKNGEVSTIRCLCVCVLVFTCVIDISKASRENCPLNRAAIIRIAHRVTCASAQISVR